METGAIELIDSPCPLLELLAGKSGLSFTQVSGFVGPDIHKRRSDIVTMTDPHDAECDALIAPGINPDVAIVHGLRADRHGDVVVSALNEDRLVVKAAKQVIAAVESMFDDALPNLFPRRRSFPRCVRCRFGSSRRREALRMSRAIP